MAHQRLGYHRFIIFCVCALACLLVGCLLCVNVEADVADKDTSTGLDLVANVPAHL
jgi:hypothetical protein